MYFLRADCNSHESFVMDLDGLLRIDTFIQ